MQPLGHRPASTYQIQALAVVKQISIHSYTTGITCCLTELHGKLPLLSWGALHRTEVRYRHIARLPVNILIIELGVQGNAAQIRIRVHVR